MTQRPLTFNVCLFRINDFYRIFEDVGAALTGALKDLGHDCVLMHNVLNRDRINIVIGGTPSLRELPGALGDFQAVPYVVYQLEPLSDVMGPAAGNVEFREFLAGAAAIWDYAPSNLAHLRGTPLSDKITLVIPGWHQSLERFTQTPEPDIDVIFHGSIRPRRFEIIQRLRAAGIDALGLTGAYGEPLDEHLRRAKIVLNLHGDEGLSVLETVRLSFLLANRCFVISEFGEYNPYGDGMVFAAYDDLVETCRHWLAEGPERRRAVAERGYATGRRIDMAAGLAQAIERLPAHVLRPRV